jgi:hypothetical protein
MAAVGELIIAPRRPGRVENNRAFSNEAARSEAEAGETLDVDGLEFSRC